MGDLMAKDMMVLEKRGSSRVPVKIPVQYHLVDDPERLKNLKGHPALAKDLNLSGMYIKTGQTVKLGDVFSLDISVPQKSKHLFAYAEVVWANKQGAGLHLLLMPDEDKEALKDYLQNDVPT